MFVDRRRAALAKIAEGLDELAACDDPVTDADEAAKLIVETERQGRRVDAARVELMDRIDAGGAYGTDGHFSAKVMVRHHGMLSGAESWGRDRTMRLLRDLPEFAAVYGTGRIGTDHVRRLAKVWTNPRIRHHLRTCEAVFIEAAKNMEYVEFDDLCTRWEHLVDEDGSDRAAKRQWRTREFKLVQDYDTSFNLRSQLTSVDGADLAEMIEHLVEAERLSDIEYAKANHGDNWRNLLPRTDAQLRYDAFMTLIRRGAAKTPGSDEPDARVAEIVMDEATVERETNKLMGQPVDPIDPIEALTNPPTCRTTSGTQLHPAEAVTHALLGHIRRVVYDSASTVIDVGRKQRLFTGSARDAALLQSVMCYWKACWVPASRCQIDHLQPWNDGGSTNPGNGAPACGHHNRIKELGFHAWRDPDGTWHITRPDGTPVPDHTTHWDDNPWGQAA